MTTMMLRGLAIFMLLIVATSVMVDIFHLQLGVTNFFDKHGVFFLIFITFFPRLTLIFSSVASGGFLWWVGLIICPRILVAALATIAYFNTNPVLVTISWLVAFSGEYLEKVGIGKSRFIVRTARTGYHHARGMEDYQEEIRSHTHIKKDDAIEAEFKKES